ncbi:MerR family transcriptional regulator [Fusibacter sp. 3D3]|uniref:MerR family transcriptional regulator n=1 Tax=Fusibacter sp. 3D3 TaxID=1048380 RepID=UPI0008537BA9|nr:MerR family transcriptional regulator [Fusibacter sp. 3D3]GAU76467.1 transcriptional regulator, MerR family [Fusibacter sp. 3D3]
MKDQFSIGEVSSIFNISVHSLRHYHKIGLIVPSCIDAETGYRHYTFDQFQFISRFKYLRSIGLSLEQIKHVFDTGKSEDLKLILADIKAQKQKELLAIQDLFAKIDFITDYYSFNEVDDTLNLIYKKSFPERYLFTSDRNQTSIESMDISLHRKLFAEKNKEISFMRQFSYVLDFDALMQNVFKPLCTSVLLNSTNKVNPDDLAVLPAGDYVCFCTHILNEGFDITPLMTYANRKREQRPTIVLAMEYEDHLHEYYNALYELQLFYPSKTL